MSVSLVASLAANNVDLQNNLVKCGVLWSLLTFLFDYDYTLDEGGIETEEKTNQQVRSDLYCNMIKPQRISVRASTINTF